MRWRTANNRCRDKWVVRDGEYVRFNRRQGVVWSDPFSVKG
jgi:hypothetical protein